jgi:hypothetical protein
MRAPPMEKQRWQKSFSPVAAFQGPPSLILLWAWHALTFQAAGFQEIMTQAANQQIPADARESLSVAH